MSTWRLRRQLAEDAANSTRIFGRWPGRRGPKSRIPTLVLIQAKCGARASTEVVIGDKYPSFYSTFSQADSPEKLAGRNQVTSGV